MALWAIIIVSLTRVCVVYVVKEVTSSRGGGALGQLMGVARNRTRAQALKSEAAM